MKTESQQGKWETRGKREFLYKTSAGHTYSVELPSKPRRSEKVFEHEPAVLTYTHKEGPFHPESNIEPTVHILSINHEGVEFSIMTGRDMDEQKLLSLFYKGIGEAWREEAFEKGDRSHQKIKAALPIFLQYLHDHRTKRKR